MGKRGPPKKPTEQKKIDGTLRAGDDKHEPKPEKGIPQPPDWFGERELECWNQITKTLLGMRVMTVADQQAVARYCQIFVEWLDCIEYLNENGLSYEKVSEGGCVTHAAYPETLQKNKLSEQLLRLEKEFGLTAASRAGIQVNAAPIISNRGRFFKVIDGKSPARKEA